MSSTYLYRKSSELHYTIALINHYLNGRAAADNNGLPSSLAVKPTENKKRYCEKLKTYRNSIRNWLEKNGHMTPATKVTHPITGERRRCDDWARKLGSNHDSVVSKRLNKGWSLIDALESPVDRARTTVPRLWGAHHDPDDFLKGYWG